MFNHSVQVGWLDLSDSEQRRAREYLRQFRTEGTLDELGFGIVRDALADVFFPATNTIMTRSRYLFFVAAALLRVEHERLSGAQAARRLKMLEDELRKILSRDSTDEDDAERRGVIGALAKENLRRYPSSIYWNALKRLGLFQPQEWGLTYYLDHLADYYKVNTPKRDDDGLAHLPIATVHNWDPALNDVLASTPGLSPDGGFSPDLDFGIGPAEARYLTARFQALAQIRGPSLLAHLLARQYQSSFIFPWEVPCPDTLKPLVSHARAFSMFAKGATLQYYDLLIEERKAQGWSSSVDSFERPFTEWWSQTREPLADWDLTDFFAQIEKKCRTRPNDRPFMTEWLRLCREATDGAALLRDPHARRVVARRERSVRPVKHRIGQEKYLRQWDPPKSLEGAEYTDPQRLPYLLDFRSYIGGVFVQEIIAGLKENP